MWRKLKVQRKSSWKLPCPWQGLVLHPASSLACTFRVINCRYRYCWPYRCFHPLNWYNLKANILSLAPYFAWDELIEPFDVIGKWMTCFGCSFARFENLKSSMTPRNLRRFIITASQGSLLSRYGPFPLFDSSRFILTRIGIFCVLFALIFLTLTIIIFQGLILSISPHSFQTISSAHSVQQVNENVCIESHNHWGQTPIYWPSTCWIRCSSMSNVPTLSWAGTSWVLSECAKQCN